MNVPEIRFKEFCDYYSDVLLEKCLSVSNKKNNKLEYKKEDALSVSDEFGVVNQIEHLGRSYTGNNISTYKILNKWQIVYTKSPLKLKPFGIIKVNNNKPGIVSVLYAIYDVKEGFDPNYISVYFEPNFRLNKYLLPLINKGAKNTINIYNPQIQISAESETKRSIFREKDKTKRSKKESAQHSKSRNKSFVMTSVSAL